MDIDGCKAHRYRLADGVVSTWELPEKTGWLLPRQGCSDFVAGCKSGIYFIDLDTGSREFAIDPEPDLPGNHINDGKCDVDGRIWAGTMDDDEVNSRAGCTALTRTSVTAGGMVPTG